jgi:hypothetical protein
MKNFESILEEAFHVANEAGDKWMSEHTKPAFAIYNADLSGNVYGDCLGTMLDVCGFGYVQITDKRTSFAKYMKTTYGSNSSVRLNHKYRNRQEWSLNEATAEAILKVLRKNEIKGVSLYSRID